MNKWWMTGTIFSVILSITGAALGQVQQFERLRRQGISSGPASETPAEIAKLNEAYRLAQAAATALSAGRFAEAEATARQSIAVDFGPGVAQEVLASALNAQGKEREALHVYQAMAYAHGDHPRNLLPYSLLLLKAGRWTPAVAAYNKALLHLADGKLMRASSHFSPAVPKPTALATALHIALGLTYDSESDWAGHTQRDKALQEYTKALQLAPNSPLTNFYYGYGLDQAGRTAQAAAVFQRTASMTKGAVRQEAEAALDRQRQAAYNLARHDPIPPRIINRRSQPSVGQ